MRRVATILLVFVFAVEATTGQNLKIGARGGVNSATFVSGNESLSDDYNRRTIFNAGLLLEKEFSNRFSVRTELVYTRRGAALEEIEIRNESGVSQGTYEKGKYEFDYLQIPILVTADLLSTSSIHPRIYAGPSVSTLIGSTLEVGEPATGDISSSPGASDIESSTIDLEGIVGAGVNYDLTSSNSIILEVRYVRGFTDVLPEGDSMVRNQVLSVNLGFLIAL